MAEQLPLNQIVPQSRPTGAMLQPAQYNTAGAARPQGLPMPKGIEMVQGPAKSSLNTPNPLYQLANDLGNFSQKLLEVGGQTYVQYAKNSIEAGYEDELKNQVIRSKISLQKQAEQGAANASSEIARLEKVDPLAAQLLADANPWKLIGRRRAAAMVAGGEIDNEFRNDMIINRADVLKHAPGSEELVKRKSEISQRVLNKYGLSGEERESVTYAIPKINAAWDAYTKDHSRLWNDELEISTKAMTTAAVGATVEEITIKGITDPDNGQMLAPGTPGWRKLGAKYLTQLIDKQLAVLEPEARRKAVEYLRAQMVQTFGAVPNVDQLLQEIRGGDASLPYEKRPTWGASAPGEMLADRLKGMTNSQQLFDLEQKTKERRLDDLWANGPAKFLPGTADYQKAVIDFDTLATKMGFQNAKEYIVKKDATDTKIRVLTSTHDPLAAQEFSVKVGLISPREWTDGNDTYMNLTAEAKRIASLNPDKAEGARQYSQMLDSIDKARSKVGRFDLQTQKVVQRAVLEDLDSPAARAIKEEQKRKKKGLSGIDAVFAQTMAGGSNAASATALYQSTKLTAFATRLEQLHERAADIAMADWQEKHPGQVMSQSAKSVVLSQAAANVRKSQEYKDAMAKLPQAPATGTAAPAKPATGTAAPARPAAAPKPVDRNEAKGLPDSRIRNYKTQALMSAEWVDAEVKKLANNKPVSAELSGLAERAKTDRYQMLYTQLQRYPQLDGSGEAKKWLLEKSKQQQRNRRLADQSMVPGGVFAGTGMGVIGAGGYNPLRPGGWLMSMLRPAQEAFPQAFPSGGGGGGGGGFEKPVSVVYETRGGQPGVDLYFPSKRFPAVLGGVVKTVSRESGYGNYVVIESIDPTSGQKVDVLYGHLADGVKVRPGQRMEAGQLVGTQGGTGNVRSADGTIASIDFFAPRPAGSKDMTPYSGFDRLRRHVVSTLNKGNGGGGGNSPAALKFDQIPGGQAKLRNLAQLAQDAGFSRSELPVMVAIAMAESGGKATAHNPNRQTGDNSYGLWQINMIDSLGPERRRQFGIANDSALLDPSTNARAARQVKGSQGFGAWSVYRSGAYKAYLSAAQQVVNQMFGR